MTGCKINNAIFCVKMIWNILSKSDNNMYNYTTPEHKFFAYIVPSMRNIDFDLGFKVDRSKLSRYMNEIDKELFCLLETSFGYAGVNIKIPLNKNKDEMIINKLEIDDENNYVCMDALYSEYKVAFGVKNKRSFNTFLVFHSGKVIFSGLTKEMMKDTYYDFINIINDGRNKIQEILD